MTTTQSPHALPAAPDIDLGGGYTQPPLPAFQTPVGAFAPTCATPGCTWYADELALWDTDYLYDTPEDALQAEWSHDTDGHWWCPPDAAKRTCEVRGHDWRDWPELPNEICARCTGHRARLGHTITCRCGALAGDEASGQYHATAARKSGWKRDSYGWLCPICR